MSTNCPTEAKLSALLSGEMPETERASLEQHLDGCASCRQRLEALAVGDAHWLVAAREYVKAGVPIPIQHVAGPLGPTRDSTIVNHAHLPTSNLTASQSPQRLGDYEILGELGRGGMGVVFKARQTGLQRDVALKVILAGQLASEAQVRRFRLEAEAVARLDHPHIVAIYEVGEHEGRHFFSMKLIAGGSLKDRRAEFQALDARSPSAGGEGAKRQRKLARLLADIARAVHHAHQRGILHRDLKPGNVLIDAQGQPQLTDFGLAKLLESDSGLTLSRAVMGTPEYMSPEQAAGQSRMITTGSDVYSLGAILYELLTGCPPFTGDDSVRLLNRVVDETPKSPRTLNPAVSRDLETICLKCLEKDPARRHRSAEALAEDLERFERGEPIWSRPVSAPQRVWRWCGRKPALAGALGGLVLVFVLGFAGVAWMWRGEIRQRRSAERASEQKRQALTRLEIERAEAQFHEGNSDNSLAYLARLVRQEATNRVVVQRLMNALTFRRYCLPVGPLKHDPQITAPPAPRNGEEPSPLLSVTAAAFSPDGRLVLTSSLDGTARFWDSQTGHPVGEPLKHEDAVLWAEFSHDGKKLVTASRDGRARIWEVQSHQLLATTPRFAGALRYASFHPDSKRFIVACDDGTAQILEVTTGQPSGKTFKHGSPVYYAAFSPDGNQVLTAEEASQEGAPGHLWDAAGDSPPLGLPHHFRREGHNLFPGFSPAGDQVLVAHEFNGLLFASRTGGPGLPTPDHKLHHDQAVLALAFSPDGLAVATGGHDATARIWSPTNTEAARQIFLHKQAVNSVQFAADGEVLLTASSDRTARLWDAHTGRALAEPLKHQAAVLSAVMSTNRLLTISEADGAWLWSVPLGRSRDIVLPKQPAGVEYVRFSPDGNLLAILHHRGVSRWDLRTGKPLGDVILPPRGGQQITDLDFSPDGKHLATALEWGNVLLWNPRATNSPLRPALSPFVHPDPRRQNTPQKDLAVHRVRFSPDSTRVVTASDDRAARVWEVPSEKPLCTLHHEARVNYAEFSPKGNQVVTASWDHTARVWSASTGNPITPALSHQGHVNWARFDPVGTRVVTASRDKTVRIWSANTGALLHTLVHADALAEAYSFDFGIGTGGIRLATVAGNTLQMWNLETGKPLGAPIRHRAQILSVRFSPDASCLVTASNDGTAWVWDANTGEQLSEPLPHQGCVTYAEFSPDGKWVVTGSSVDDRVRVWPVIAAPMPAPDWLPILAEALAGQRIHENEVSEAVPVLNLFELRRRWQTNSASDYYANWARWFLAEPQGHAKAGFFDLPLTSYP